MTEQGPQDPRKAYADWKAPGSGKEGGKGGSTLGIIEGIEEISPEEAERLVKAAKYNTEIKAFNKSIPQIGPERLLNKLSKYIPDNKQYKGERYGFFKKESEWRKFMTSVVKDYAYAVRNAISQSARKDGIPVADFDINKFQFNEMDKITRRNFHENFSNEAEEELVTEMKRIEAGDHS